MAGSLRNTANRIRTASQIRSSHRKAVGGGRKRCKKGKNCSAACIRADMACLVDMPIPVSQSLSKLRQFRMKAPTPPKMSAGTMQAPPEMRGHLQLAKGMPRQMRPYERQGAPAATAGPAPSASGDYSKWSPVAEGNYGKVSVSPDGTRAVKELLVGKDGKKGEFGEFEVELAKKMGELGHSPRIYKATDKALEMDVAPGQPLWKEYKRGEDEPVMNTAQATKAAAAIRDLHKLGYAHGDLHALQFIANGDDVKLVDYGLSVPTARQPVRVLQDLSKINSLVRWNNPEIANDPYVQVVNKHLSAYRGVKGESKAAKAEKERIAQEYLRDVKALKVGGSTPAAASPKAAMGTKVSEAKPATGKEGGPTQQGNWRSTFSGRSEKLDAAMESLNRTVDALPPEQRAFWQNKIQEKFGMKGVENPVHTGGKPYTGAEIDASLTSQARGWERLIKDGAPKETMDRANNRLPAPRNMIPDTTFSGQRKWISPEDNLVYSAPKTAADKAAGVWGQNRASTKDTLRRLPEISSFRRSQEAKGESWPIQKLSPRPDLPKSVDEILSKLTAKEKSDIMFNGLNKTDKEGKLLKDWYKANPREAEMRLREVVQRWFDQGGRSGISGMPIAIPGLAPKAGEARSSVDHFTPISTGKVLTAPELRKQLDNFKNMLAAEEGPNSSRSNKPWPTWLDARENSSAPKAKKVSAAQRKKDEAQKAQADAILAEL